ncbi:NAD-dependent epimerase/dehydratase family protein [uncultured Friedmanniella sp.]|uniref:polysaccharide biosynthesis C-terminal domain-containing protein n=1 Tax=uncultured Friedmanniella sp. TaxID=335381 RepID=UPI0035CB156E
MKVLVTGAGGFLGWHVGVRVRAERVHSLVAVDRSGWTDLPQLLSHANAVLHLAGVNRGSEDEVVNGNLALAHELAEAVRRAERPPTHLVYANSVQALTTSPYGSAKAEAATVLAAAATEVGTVFVDVLLPNLLGEHGRPRYNSFVATFVDAVLRGDAPQVADRPITLLHAQGAAQVLLRALAEPQSTQLHPGGHDTSVITVLATLQQLHRGYHDADLPELTDPLHLELFNMLRSAAFPAGSPRPLLRRADQRGALTEVVRSPGGGGQTFVSTTLPGITRGEHFHLRKVERFVVLDGQARIELRRVLHDEVVGFDVDGEQPCLVDMPTMWVHNITNTGSTPLTTLFWTNELFDPAHPDTYPEPVRQRQLAHVP